ncbi:hypothetical protein [Staphylococcus sp. IVB6227]|uniref:hypothetical protein n=1 Tax=Staphylococcus sp. IVB6227 TaxID=2989768 RepID=UPI0021CE6FC5|nr:hypothetical protein [Staphylococcus sp. IVB6227]UXR79062.1 hypothetical protein MUA92_04005 [Staphylococcus sp. IVB6227]
MNGRIERNEKNSDSQQDELFNEKLNESLISNLLLKQAELEEEIKKTSEVNATLLLTLANREGVTSV